MPATTPSEQRPPPAPSRIRAARRRRGVTALNRVLSNPGALLRYHALANLRLAGGHATLRKRFGWRS